MAAVGLCVAAGLLLAVKVIPELGGVLGAFFVVTTAIPLLFRRRTGFLVASWVSLVVVVVFGGFLLVWLLAFVFLPAVVPLLPVVILRAGRGTRPRPVRWIRLRLAQLTRYDVARRPALVAVIGVLMDLVAAVSG